MAAVVVGSDAARVEEKFAACSDLLEYNRAGPSSAVAVAVVVAQWPTAVAGAG